MRYFKYAIAFLATSILANETINIEDDFLQSLNQVNQVAAKTKLNRDRTTSLINVLQGKKLQKLGVDNVYEALRYIPGIELSKESTGTKSVIFRGSITKGEVKFMIDGVEINNAYRGSFYYFLDFPIELISRIEVLRGPGSVLHGSGAISGVINIITKSSQDSSTDNNEIFLSGGSYKYGKGGARVNIYKENYKLSVDAYYQENDKEIDSSDQRFNDYSTGLNFKAYDFEFNARIKDSTRGNAYGVFNIKDTNKNNYDNTNQAFYSNLKYSSSVSDNNDLKITLNYNKYSQIIEANAGIYLKSDFEEETYNTNFELVNTSIEGNEFLIGANFKHNNSLKTGLYGHPTESNIVLPNLDRDIYSAYVLNNYLLTNNINISLGLRYDDYSDFGDNFSPDLGLVYRANKDMSFKLKYAKAFRAPSWTELYGLNANPNLKAEVSENIEFGLVYKYESSGRISLNTYHMLIEDYIQSIAGVYSQESELDIHGVELDLSYNPVHNIEFSLVSSYSDAKDKYNHRIDYVANFLTTASLIYTSKIGLVFGSTLRYTNSKDMDNEAIFDQSISYNYKDINIKLIVKNMFNSGIIYYDSAHNETNPIKDAARVALIKASMEF